MNIVIDSKAAYGYRDFETVFTIHIALSMHSISRLSETWKNLDSKSRHQWHNIDKLATHNGNYKSYRKHMKNIFANIKSPNVLPYIGLYLRDLAALEEGSTNFDNRGAGSIP